MVPPAFLLPLAISAHFNGLILQSWSALGFVFVKWNEKEELWALDLFFIYLFIFPEMLLTGKEDTLNFYRSRSDSFTFKPCLLKVHQIRQLDMLDY